MPPRLPPTLTCRSLVAKTKVQSRCRCHHVPERLFPIYQRAFSTSARRLATQLPENSPKQDGTKQNKKDEFVLLPLSRPLGFDSTPLPGENTGLDPRDWRTRRDDFFDYDKHQERRKHLTKQMATPYFRDWTNMRHQKGKVFLAPTKLFRADKALYFPNLWGFTLASPKDERDTTPILHGKISIVAVYSETWAEQQTKTFLENNETLDRVLEAGQGFIQRADINIEQSRMKAMLVKMFMGRIRKSLPEERHGKYFLVTQGVTTEMRERLGMFNERVGYIYVLDSECRVRWACNAEALADEKDSLVRGLARLSKELNSKIEDKDAEVQDLSNEVIAAVRKGVAKVSSAAEP